MPDADPSPAPPPSSDPPTATVEKAKPSKAAPSSKPGKLPPYNVVLLNDDHHSYEYVIEMLGALFGYGKERAFQLAEEVDTQGRVILLTTHKEKAELKRDQVTAYGADFRMESSQGSMSAIIEPAR